MKHDWRSGNGNRIQFCRRCGATRTNSQIYIRYKPQWSPAMLDGKRQPLCPYYHKLGSGT